MSAADHRGLSADASVKRRREASPPSASSFAVELSALPPPPAYFDPKQNGRNKWQLYRFQKIAFDVGFLENLESYACLQKEMDLGQVGTTYEQNSLRRFAPSARKLSPGTLGATSIDPFQLRRAALWKV